MHVSRISFFIFFMFTSFTSLNSKKVVCQITAEGPFKGLMGTINNENPITYSTLQKFYTSPDNALLPGLYSFIMMCNKMLHNTFNNEKTEESLIPSYEELKKLFPASNEKFYSMTFIEPPQQFPFQHTFQAMLVSARWIKEIPLDSE